MSNKDIEDNIKELNRLYDIAEVVLPEYSTAKIVYRISENQKIAIKNILVYTEELQKENKLLKNRQGIGTIKEVNIKNLSEVLSPYYILKSEVKDLQAKADKYDALEKQVKKYKNMYEAEHRIHLVRNEQLARKERAVLKANKYDNLISEIKSEIEAIKDKRSKLGFKTYLKREDMIREDSILLGEQKALQKLLKTIEGEKK